MTMSEPRTLSGREDVRKGDVLRREYINGGGPCVAAVLATETRATAVEYVAAVDKHWLDPSQPGLLILLDRPVVLPTALYSIVAPPEGEESRLYPYILDRGGNGQTVWRETRNGESAKPEEVARNVGNGWRIIDAKEEGTE